jgi:hypothetical protein
VQPGELIRIKNASSLIVRRSTDLIQVNARTPRAARLAPTRRCAA